MNFDELLGEYKANPRRESAALLLSDPVLLKYCVIFKQVPVRRFEDYLSHPGRLYRLQALPPVHGPRCNARAD